MKKIITLAMILLPFIDFAQKGYEKSIEAGAGIGIGEYHNTAFALSMINGYRFNHTLYAGIGVGIGYSNRLNGVTIDEYNTTEYRTDAILIPIFVRVKTNLSDNDIMPYLSLDAGYTLDVNQYLKDAPGLMIEPDFGIEFPAGSSTLYVATGFNLQKGEYDYVKDAGTQNAVIETRSEMFKSIALKIGIWL